MDADRLFDAIGDIGGDLIEEAHTEVKRRRGGVRLLRFAAAAVLVFAALGIFFSTAPGRAFAEYVQTMCEDLIEKLFPPREMNLTLEGLEDVTVAEAHGEIAPPDSASQWADYVIYVEEDGNEITKRANYFRLTRPIGENNPNYSGLPEMYMEIVQIAGTTPDALAEQIVSDELALGRLTHTGTDAQAVEGRFLCLNFLELPEDGRSGSDCCRNYYICDNGKGGCFKVTVQYFLEAAEGFGSRCQQYLSTFEILD